MSIFKPHKTLLNTLSEAFEPREHPSCHLLNFTRGYLTGVIGVYGEFFNLRSFGQTHFGVLDEWVPESLFYSVECKFEYPSPFVVRC